MKIIVWKGSHGNEIYSLIKETFLSQKQLLIICPPRFKIIDDYLAFLPTSKVEFKGELDYLESFDHFSTQEYTILPKFGLFSSGTSDENPKLILYTNENLIASNKGILSFFKKLDINTIYSYPQPYHIFGLALGYILSISQNIKLIMREGKYSRNSHELWKEVVDKYGDQLLTLGTPTHFEDLCEYTNNKNNTSLTCIIGGAIVSQKLWDKTHLDLKISYPSIGYGCSEASPGVTHLQPGVRPLRTNCIGSLIPGLKIEFSDNKISIQGDNICLAIVNANGISFLEGEYQLPDIIKQNNDKSYLYIGRNDFIINRGGEKFSIEEVEKQLFNKFGESIIVTYRKNLRLGDELCFLVLKSYVTKSNDIFEFLSDKYSRNFDSSNFKYINEFPKNPNLKLDRKKCHSFFKEDTNV